MLERRSALTAVTIPLAAIGAVSLLPHLKAQVGRAIRKIINLFDPIQPSQDFVVASIYERPLLLPPQVERHIQEKENKVIAGAECKVVWANETKSKTPLCVVFLHGWGACRQECRPVPELIAKALNANLYCGRLPGHGRKHPRGMFGGLTGPDGDALEKEANSHAIFLSAIDALRVGLSLGQKVVLVGMSTGGALATWLASLPATQSSIAALVLISPAYALGHPLYPVLKHTFSTLRLVPFFGDTIRAWLMSVAVGSKTKTSPVLSEEHNRYNCLTYPSRALLHLLDVLWELESIDCTQIQAPTIMIGNPQDHVINFRVKAINSFLRFGDAPKALYCVTRAEHPHVIASEMLSPSTVNEIASAAILFLNENVSTDKSISSQDGGVEWKKPRRSMLTQRIGSFRSVPTGLSNYASFPSLKDLTRPLQA